MNSGAWSNIQRMRLKIVCCCGRLVVTELDVNVGFFFNDTATTEIYTLSLHDALPISENRFVLLYTVRLQ